MLLGRMESDGSRRPGCVDKFGVDTSEIISEIAKDTERQGCLEDAVHLYDLAKVQCCFYNTFGQIGKFLLIRIMRRHCSCYHSFLVR